MKNATHKESLREVSCPRAKFNGRPGLPGWPGKMAQHRLWARHAFCRRERLRKLAHAQESPVGVELVLERGNFCLRAGLLLGMAPFLK
jgi:hypothetical protein